MTNLILPFGVVEMTVSVTSHGEDNSEVAALVRHLPGALVEQSVRHANYLEGLEGGAGNSNRHEVMALAVEKIAAAGRQFRIKGAH